MTTEKFTIPRAFFDRYPNDDAIDPVEAICDVLHTAGHPNPRKWTEKLDPQVTDHTVDRDLRRMLVNQYWRVTVGMLEEDTTNARYCLMDKGPYFTWLMLFGDMMVPYIVKYQLPNLDW